MSSDARDRAAAITQEYIEKYGAGFGEIDILDAMIAAVLQRERREALTEAAAIARKERSNSKHVELEDVVSEHIAENIERLRDTAP